MKKMTIEDFDANYHVQDTRKVDEKVVWATLPAMKALYNMAWVLRDHLEQQRGIIARQQLTIMKELVELTRTALRKEARTAQVPGNAFVEESTAVVGFDIHMSKMLVIKNTLRDCKDQHGSRMLRRFEGYLYLLECAMNEAEKSYFSAESA